MMGVEPNGRPTRRGGWSRTETICLALALRPYGDHMVWGLVVSDNSASWFKPICVSPLLENHIRISPHEEVLQDFPIMRSPLDRILPTIERPILDVIKFVVPGPRKTAPPPQRPLWQQSLCGLETRALALQRD